MSAEGARGWCAAQRETVAAYLQRQGLDHGAIGDEPAWFIDPYVAIWAIESVKAPGAVGWWVITGDLPTDYCSAGNCRAPRYAAKFIAEQWLSALARTQPGDSEIADTGLSSELAPLLKTRADLLLQWSAGDDLWQA